MDRPIEWQLKEPLPHRATVLGILPKAKVSKTMLQRCYRQHKEIHHPTIIKGLMSLTQSHPCTFKKSSSWERYGYLYNLLFFSQTFLNPQCLCLTSPWHLTSLAAHLWCPWSYHLACIPVVLVLKKAFLEWKKWLWSAASEHIISCHQLRGNGLELGTQLKERSWSLLTDWISTGCVSTDNSFVSHLF